MKKREDLLRTEEYWFETLQNEIYRMVVGHIQENSMTQTQLAENLGVTKGYVSQILNGNFNYTLKKMIELSLALGKAPVFEFKDLNEFIKDDQQKRCEILYKPFFNIDLKPLTVKISSGETIKSGNISKGYEVLINSAA